MSLRTFATTSSRAYSTALTAKMKFYYAKMCPFAHRVNISLHECVPGMKGVESVEIDLKNKPDWYLKVNPQGKTPAMQLEDGTVLIESAILAEYVAEKYGSENGFLPKDPMQKYKMRIFANDFAPQVQSKFYALLKAQTKEEQDKVAAELLDGLKKANDAIVGPFVLGSQFTLADALTVPILFRFYGLEYYRNFKIPETPEYEKIHQWIKACDARESLQLTKPDNDTILRGYEDFATGKKAH